MAALECLKSPYSTLSYKLLSSYIYVVPVSLPTLSFLNTLNIVLPLEVKIPKNKHVFKFDSIFLVK